MPQSIQERPYFSEVGAVTDLLPKIRAEVVIFRATSGHYLEVEPLTAHQFITNAIGKREFRVRQIREWLSGIAQPLRD